MPLAFAFPNEQGTQLLVTGEIAKPDALRIALCTGGQQLSVQFERRQPEGRNTTNRQAPQNFAQTAGAVFRIIGGKVSPEATCVLAEESFLAGATVRAAEASVAGRALLRKRRIRTSRRTKAARSSAAGQLPNRVREFSVAIIEFARRLTQALASLVVIDGERRMYVDYSAEFKGPGDDLWRVDDGGEIHAEGFEVVFLLKRGTTYVLAVDWAGAEGNALSVHTAEGGGQFKEVISDSWYRSPM